VGPRDALGVAALLLAAALPPAAASEVSGHLEADRVVAVRAHLEGPLLAFVQDFQGSGGASPRFTYEAAGLDIGVDSARAVAGSAVNPETRTEHAEHARAEGLRVTGAYRWSLLARDAAHPPTVSADADCAALSPGSAASVSRVAKVQSQAGRPEARVRTDGALALVRCDAGMALTIRGDFELALWGWDVDVAGSPGTPAFSDGAEAYWSGERNPAGAPSPPDASPAVADAQELYLSARNGTLSLPSLEGEHYTIYLGRADAGTASGSLSLERAHGSLAMEGTEAPVAGQEVRLSGPASATVTRSGSVLAVEPGGSPPAILLDGRPSGLGTAGPPAPPPSFWPLAAAFGVAFAALAVAGIAWRRSPARTLRLKVKAAAAVESHSYRRAMRLANRALRAAPGDGHLLLLRAYVHTCRDEPELALRDHAAAHAALADKDAHAAARNAIEASRTCGALRRIDEALAWLDVGAGLRPGVAEPALLEPDMAEVRGAWLRRLASAGYC
jgi:hypothetical protein